MTWTMIIYRFTKCLFPDLDVTSLHLVPPFSGLHHPFFADSDRMTREPLLWDCWDGTARQIRNVSIYSDSSEKAHESNARSHAGWTGTTVLRQCNWVNGAGDPGSYFEDHFLVSIDSKINANRVAYDWNSVIILLAHWPEQKSSSPRAHAQSGMARVGVK